MQSTIEDLLSEKANPRPVLKDISIVIPTLGRPILEQCLGQIARGSAWPFEIIVVDQSQNKQVEQWIERLTSTGLSTRYLPSGQRGRAAGVNRGLDQLNTRFVAITDDDCFVDEKWLENVADSLSKHPGSIVTGRVEAAGEGTLIVVTSRTKVIYNKPRLKFDSMSGGNMATSLEVIRQVGKFDEDPRLATAEDGEWSYRALRKGISIVYVPDMIVLHYGWRDKAGLSHQFSGYARSHGGFYGKYIRKGDWFILLRAVLHHYRALRWWVRGVATRNPDLTLNGKAYFTGLLPGILAGFKIEQDRKISGD